jgi:hypothetical protein
MPAPRLHSTSTSTPSGLFVRGDGAFGEVGLEHGPGLFPGDGFVVGGFPRDELRAASRSQLSSQSGVKLLGRKRFVLPFAPVPEAQDLVDLTTDEERRGRGDDDALDITVVELPPTRLPALQARGAEVAEQVGLGPIDRSGPSPDRGAGGSRWVRMDRQCCGQRSCTTSVPVGGVGMAFAVATVGLTGTFRLAVRSVMRPLAPLRPVRTLEDGSGPFVEILES